MKQLHSISMALAGAAFLLSAAALPARAERDYVVAAPAEDNVYDLGGGTGFGSGARNTAADEAASAEEAAPANGEAAPAAASASSTTPVVAPAATGPYAFKVLIDVNLLNANDAANIAMLSAADGVWAANVAPYGGPTIDWSSVIDSLTHNGTGRLVTEDTLPWLLSDRPTTYAAVAALGKNISQSMVYYETTQTSAQGPVIGTSENDSILLSKLDQNGQQVYVHYTAADGSSVPVAAPDQIGKASKLTGGNSVIVNSRSFQDSDPRQYYTKAALSNPANGGVSFELNQSFPFSLQISDGLTYCLNLGKSCYLLLSYDVTQANASFPNYLSLVQQMLAYLAPTGILANPNFYLVLPVYGSAIQTATTFVQNPLLSFINPANVNDPNSLLGVLSWVKANYPTGQSASPPVSPDVTGNIDGVSANADGTATISGWACALYDVNPIAVQVAVGGAALGTYQADRASGKPVAEACQSTGKSYRFDVKLTAAFVQNHAGELVTMNGVSPWGLANNALSGSGSFPVPAVAAAK